MRSGMSLDSKGSRFLNLTANLGAGERIHQDCLYSSRVLPI
jgi:hypothetical protein